MSRILVEIVGIIFKKPKKKLDMPAEIRYNLGWL